jgi:hypothetical protein
VLDPRGFCGIEKCRHVIGEVDPHDGSHQVDPTNAGSEPTNAFKRPLLKHSQERRRRAWRPGDHLGAPGS